LGNNRIILLSTIIPSIIIPQLALPLGLVGGSIADKSDSMKSIAVFDEHLPTKYANWNGTAVLRITGWPNQKQNKWEASAVIIATNTSSKTNILPGPMDGILIKGKGKAPGLWSIIGASITGHAPKMESVESGFSMRKYLNGRGIKWIGRLENHNIINRSSLDFLSWPSLNILTPAREKSLHTINSSLPRREAVLFSSVIFAEKSTESKIVKSSFTSTGTAHLFAVSGLHVGILVSVLTALSSLFPVSNRAKHLFIILAVVFYTLLAGLPVSAVRASMFVGVCLIASHFGRKTDSLHILSIIFVMAVIWSPASTSDVGFQLSFLATGVILIGSRYASRLNNKLWTNKLIAALFVSSFAYWGTLPIVAKYFGSINILAPIINCIAIPVFGLGVWLTFIALLIPINFIQEPLLALGWLPVRLIEAGISFLSEISLLQQVAHLESILSTAVYLGVTIFILIFSRSASRYLFSILLITVSVYFFNPSITNKSSENLIVTQFDIGQGDCALFQFPDGSNVIIDTGPGWSGGDSFSRGPSQWMKKQGISNISDLLMTHNHLDHTGGTTSLINDFKVESIWCGGGSFQSINHRYQIPAAGDTIHYCNKWAIVCMFPEPDYNDMNENNNSTLVGLYFDSELKGVWTGDLEKEGEKQFLESSQVSFNSIDVLKAGHHGSSTSSSIDFLNYFNPTEIVISCGLENRHNHPSHGPFISKYGQVNIHRTDFGGSLTLTWDNNGVFEGISTTTLDTLHVDSYYPGNSSSLLPLGLPEN
jgi:competence protein ComEC